MKKFLIPIAVIFLTLLIVCTLFTPRRFVDLPILMYHDVSPSGTEPGLYSVSEDKFRRDMEYLHQNGYKTITVDDLIEYRETSTLPIGKTVMITFDDGYLTNYTIAYPILKELGLKATIAVIGKNIDGDEYTQFMNVAQAAELQQSGVIDIQSHTYDLHNNSEFLVIDSPFPYGVGIARFDGELKDQYQNRLRRDIEMSRDLLDRIGSEFKLLAYPFGIYDKWAGEVLKSMDIKATLRTENKLQRYTGSNYGLVRLSVYEDTDLSEILP